MNTTAHHEADAHLADAQDAWAGYLLSALANIDPKFAEWAIISDYLSIHGRPNDYTVFVYNSFSAHEVIRRYVRATSPSPEPGESVLSKRHTDDAACALYADALTELEVDVDNIDAEFTLFALAYFTAPPSRAIAALYWDLIWLSCESPLSGELYSAASSGQIHDYFLQPLEELVQEPATDGMWVGEANGRTAVYQHAIAERTAVMSTGFSLYDDVHPRSWGIIDRDMSVPDVPATTDELLALIDGPSDDMLAQRNHMPDGAPTGNGLD